MGFLLPPNSCIILRSHPYELLKQQYSFWHRGKIYIKGRGELDTYMLLENLEKRAKLEASQSVELPEVSEVAEHNFVLIP